MSNAVRTTKPIAGPGAGIESFFFKFGDHRVRLAANKKSPIKVIGSGSDITLIKDGKPIVSGRLEAALSHCPEQAYLTISGRCVYDCKFCPVPSLAGEVKGQEEIFQIVQESWKTGHLRAISLTSGVESSVEDEAKRAVSIVSALRARYDVPIGVSIYPTKTSSADLKQAGATEIKYNVETMDPKIFAKVCQNLSLEHVLKSLEKAVPIFGKNRVSSNFIQGLGESDECVLAGVATLTEMGVIPILRPISPHPLRRRDIDVERPSADRLLRLSRETKKILEAHDLRPDLAEPI
ncbi:MAG: radical SAM protein [Methanothrix sp.]|nr:radical SAM protein [Methanothrix sp.]